MLKDFLSNEKKKLRKRLKTARNAMSKNQRIEAENQISAFFISNFSGYTHYGAYYPINNEVDILPILRLLSEARKNLSLPCIHTDHLLFHHWQLGAPLNKTKYTFEPSKTAPAASPEIILTPLIGFDRKGYRLGYGGGYYDHYYKSHKNVVKVGIAFAFQEVDQLPIEDHDQRLDFIITEKEILSCSV